MRIDRTCFKSCLESTEDILILEVCSVSVLDRCMVNDEVYTTLGNPNEFARVHALFSLERHCRIYCV